jgi:RimJ/RimL family protein N-acetyltransferase
MESLTTERLVLPGWEERFAENLVKMSADERVMRYTTGGVWTPEYAAQRHAAALRNWAAHGFGWRAILWAGDGTFLGLAAAGWTRETVPGIGRPAVEIGWWVEPHAWGQGIATEAAAAMLDDVFRRTTASFVMAGCHPGNTASERIMVKLGMTRYPDITDSYGMPARIYAIPRPS